VVIFTPVIDSQGNLNVSVRADKRITAALNAPGAFAGKISSSANIALTGEDVAALWNREHPENPLGSGTAPVPAASLAD
jgi:hypothetical protein